MPSASARKRVKLHQYPCAVCKQNCANDSVHCGSCKNWVHALYEGITVSELNVLSGNYNCMCRVCIKNNDGDEFSYMNALFWLNEAASLSVDHLCVIARREKCLLPPLQSSYIKDTSSLRIDFTALGFLECNSRNETDTLQPFMTMGDGNCLFNALSIGLCGSETLSAEIRARTCIEMSVNCDYYTTQPYATDFSLCSPSFAEAIANYGNKKNIEMILGTDDERAMINATDMAFPGYSRKLCSKHLKDNILRQMTDKIAKSTIDRKEIVDMIFGGNGVATANDSATFEERNIKLKNNLEKQRHSDFLQYYVRHVEDKLANYIISSDEDQLWTNNNTESTNHRLKVKLNWEPRKTDELVEKIFELVKVEMVDLRRALYGTGNFCLNTRFSKFKITKLSWTSKTEEEKQQLFSKFLSASTTSVSGLTSSDGKYTVPKDPKVARKPNQRTRCRSTKTRSK